MIGVTSMSSLWHKSVRDAWISGGRGWNGCSSRTSWTDNKPI